MPQAEDKSQTKLWVAVGIIAALIFFVWLALIPRILSRTVPADSQQDTGLFSGLKAKFSETIRRAEEDRVSGSER